MEMLMVGLCRFRRSLLRSITLRNTVSILHNELFKGKFIHSKFEKMEKKKMRELEKRKETGK